MPVAASYTEATLADFLVLQLGAFATPLGWTASDPQIVQAVHDTERQLGVSDIAEAPDAGCVEVVGTVMVLRRAVGAWAWQAQDVTIGDVRVAGSQGLTGLRGWLGDAEYAAAVAGCLADVGGGVIRVDSLVYPQDPYAYYPDELRTLP